MMRKNSLALFSLCLTMIGPLGGQDLKSSAKKSSQIALSSDEQWQMALDCFAKNQFHQALQFAKSTIAHLNFRDRPHALFLIGQCQYQLGEWDISAAQFAKVVELDGGGEFLEPSLKYLWQIAEKYRCRVRHHLLGYESLPRWSADQSPCLPLYNQISEALPFSNLAGQALLAKGKYLREIGDFGLSNDALLALTTSFSSSRETGESYRLIGLNLLDLMQLSPGNEELLSSALHNLDRIKISSANSKEFEIADQNVQKMRALLAESLIKTGKFYERKKKSHAAIIYYQSVLDRFGNSESAPIASKRLTALNKDQAR